MITNHAMLESLLSHCSLFFYFHRLLDEEEAVEEMNELDKNLDKKIHWPEFLQAHFSYNEDELKEFRYKNNKENEELMRVSTKTFLLIWHGCLT